MRVLAVQPLGHEAHAPLDGATAQRFRPQRFDDLQHAIQPVEEQSPATLLVSRRFRRRRADRGEEFLDAHATRISRPLAQRRQHQQGHHDGARPVGHPGQMDREPARQQRQLDRDGRHVFPRKLAELRQQDAREDIGPRRPAIGQDRRPGLRHMRRIRAVADHFQAEIGFHRRADVERAIMEQRPAAILGLDAAEIGADLALQLRIVRLTQILAQQDVLGRDRRIRLELEHPVPVVALLTHQRLRGTPDVGLDGESIVGRVVQRSLDRRRQPGGRPIAGEKQVGPARPARRTPRVLRRRRREGRPFLLDDAAGRRRTA